MVILRDLSEVDEGNFSQISYIGTPLERQIRAHFTRADDLLNRSGYFFFRFGVPLSILVSLILIVMIVVVVVAGPVVIV
jgi:hypothetical protein